MHERRTPEDPYGVGSSWPLIAAGSRQPATGNRLGKQVRRAGSSSSSDSKSMRKTKLDLLQQDLTVSELDEPGEQPCSA